MAGEVERNMTILSSSVEQVFPQRAESRISEVRTDFIIKNMTILRKRS
jgi:hypothetical protein